MIDGVREHVACAKEGLMLLSSVRGAGCSGSVCPSQVKRCGLSEPRVFHAAADGILDGDFLAQLEHLPHAMAQQVLNGVDRADIASMLGKADENEALDAVISCCRSVESVLQVLDRTLSVLWPPP